MPSILLIEDDPKDLELAERAFEKCQISDEILVARDGQEALDCLHRVGQADVRPDGLALVLLDIKLPKIDGLQVLKEIRSNLQHCCVPVVILTASRLEQDYIASYHHGANGIVIKPVEFDAFVDTVHRTCVFWTHHNQVPRTGRCEPRDGAWI